MIKTAWLMGRLTGSSLAWWWSEVVRQVATDALAAHASTYSVGGGRIADAELPRAPRADEFGDGRSRAQGDQAEHGRARPAQVNAASLELLAQGIQQLQQLQLRKDTLDPELLKGTIDLP